MSENTQNLWANLVHSTHVSHGVVATLCLAKCGKEETHSGQDGRHQDENEKVAIALHGLVVLEFITLVVVLNTDGRGRDAESTNQKTRNKWSDLHYNSYRKLFT